MEKIEVRCEIPLRKEGKKKKGGKNPSNRWLLRESYKGVPGVAKPFLIGRRRARRAGIPNTEEGEGRLHVFRSL